MSDTKIKNDELKAVIANIRKIMGELGKATVQMSMVAAALEKRIKE